MFPGEGAARLANSFTLSQQIGYRFIRREYAAEGASRLRLQRPASRVSLERIGEG